MVASVLAHETITAPSNPQVLDLHVLAGKLTNDALAHARERLDRRDHGLEVAALLGRPHFVAGFKAELAIGLAAALAENDRRVQAVYTYDPTLNADSEDGVELSPDWNLHLIVRVESASAALEAFIGALDRALVEDLQKLSPPFFGQLRSWINATIVTDQDVRLGRGAAGRPGR